MPEKTRIYMTNIGIGIEEASTNKLSNQVAQNFVKIRKTFFNTFSYFFFSGNTI